MGSNKSDVTRHHLHDAIKRRIQQLLHQAAELPISNQRPTSRLRRMFGSQDNTHIVTPVIKQQSRYQVGPQGGNQPQNGNWSTWRVTKKSKKFKTIEGSDDVFLLLPACNEVISLNETETVRYCFRVDYYASSSEVSGTVFRLILQHDAEESDGPSSITKARIDYHNLNNIFHPSNQAKFKFVPLQIHQEIPIKFTLLHKVIESLDHINNTYSTPNTQTWATPVCRKNSFDTDFNMTDQDLVHVAERDVQIFQSAKAAGGLSRCADLVTQFHQRPYNLDVCVINYYEKDSIMLELFNGLVKQSFTGIRILERHIDDIIYTNSIDTLSHLYKNMVVVHLGVHNRSGIEQSVAMCLPFKKHIIYKEPQHNYVVHDDDVIMKLPSMVEVVDTAFTDVIRFLDEKVKIIWQDMSSRTVDRKMHRNPKQADLCLGMASSLVIYTADQGVNPSKMLILTPYWRQEGQLKKKLKKSELTLKRVKIMTFKKAFKSYSKNVTQPDVVIISTAITSDKHKGRIGMFKHYPEDLIRAMIRAKKEVYVIGCLTTFRESGEYGALKPIHYKDSQRKGLIVRHSSTSNTFN